MKSPTFVLSDASSAKLNLVSVMTGENPEKILSDAVEARFQAVKPEIRNFEDRISQFQIFKKAAGIKRIYRKRKAHKRKAK